MVFLCIDTYPQVVTSLPLDLKLVGHASVHSHSHALAKEYVCSVVVSSVKVTVRGVRIVRLVTSHQWQITRFHLGVTQCRVFVGRQWAKDGSGTHRWLSYVHCMYAARGYVMYLQLPCGCEGSFQSCVDQHFLSSLTRLSTMRSIHSHCLLRASFVSPSTPLMCISCSRICSVLSSFVLDESRDLSLTLCSASCCAFSLCTAASSDSAYAF